MGFLPARDRDSDVLSGTTLPAVGASVPRSELLDRIRQAHIFAKVSLYHKLQIIELLQEGSAKVSMLGDGVNDGLALQAADVAISVDTDTEIAKEASNIISLRLLEKSQSAVTHGKVD